MTTSSWGMYHRTGMWVSCRASAWRVSAEHRAAQAHDDVAVAGEQVDALERVVRVTGDRVGLLDPGERRPLEDDPAAEVGVLGGEGGRG